MHNRAGKHGKLHCWMEERGEGERGEKRGLNSYLDVVLICWKRVAPEDDGEELQPERREELWPEGGGWRLPQI